MSSRHTRDRESDKSVTRAQSGDKMTIRIVKLPPAPLIDGHDVRMYRNAGIGAVYHADRVLAQYLIAAGYAVLELTPVKVDEPRTRRPRAR
jgi:hypothetical protein